MSNEQNKPVERDEHKELGKRMIFVAVLIFFALVGSYMEVKKFKFGHETTVIIVVGMIISYIEYID